MIDTKPEEELRETWSRFVHTHHYQFHADFYDSWIANHPRLTGEAYWSQYMDARFIEPHRVPRTASFPDPWSWVDPLIVAEAALMQTTEGVPEVSRVPLHARPFLVKESSADRADHFRQHGRALLPHPARSISASVFGRLATPSDPSRRRPRTHRRDKPSAGRGAGSVGASRR
jgi:hypothetical protein